MSKKSLSIRIDETMLEQLHAVAEYEGRTTSSQVMILIRECVEKFEREQLLARQRAMALERQLEKAKKRPT